MARPNANEDLSAWLDGELTEAERAEIDAMLASDPELRAELDEIEAVAGMLREHGPVRAPPGFEARLLERVAAEPAPGGWWAWLRRPFGLPIEGIAVAAVALLVLLVALPVTLSGTVASYRSTLEEAGRSASSSSRGKDDVTSSRDAKDDAPVAATQEAPAEPDAVADLDEEAPSDLTIVRGAPAKELDYGAPDPQKTKSAKPAPPPSSSPGWDAPDANVGGTASGGTAVDDLAGTKVATSATPPPDALHSSLGYEIVTTDPGALSTLKAIVYKNRGTITDGRGNAVTAAAVKDDAPHTYVVNLPPDNLPDFGDAIRSLGQVREVRDDTLHSGPFIPVQVTLRLDLVAPKARYADEMMAPSPSTPEPTGR